MKDLTPYLVNAFDIPRADIKQGVVARNVRLNLNEFEERLRGAVAAGVSFYLSRVVPVSLPFSDTGRNTITVVPENVDTVMEFYREYFTDDLTFVYTEYDWVRTPKTGKIKAGSPEPFAFAWPDPLFSGKLSEQPCSKKVLSKFTVLNYNLSDGVSAIIDDVWSRMDIRDRESLTSENVIGDFSSCPSKEYHVKRLSEIIERYFGGATEITVCLGRTLDNPIFHGARPSQFELRILSNPYREEVDELKRKRDEAICAYYDSKRGYDNFTGD